MNERSFIVKSEVDGIAGRAADPPPDTREHKRSNKCVAGLSVGFLFAADAAADTELNVGR